MLPERTMCRRGWTNRYVFSLQLEVVQGTENVTSG
jgi:hypothetical protein